MYRRVFFLDIIFFYVVFLMLRFIAADVFCFYIFVRIIRKVCFLLGGGQCNRAWSIIKQV